MPSYQLIDHNAVISITRKDTDTFIIKLKVSKDEVNTDSGEVEIREGTTLNVELPALLIDVEVTELPQFREEIEAAPKKIGLFAKIFK